MVASLNVPQILNIYTYPTEGPIFLGAAGACGAALDPISYFSWQRRKRMDRAGNGCVQRVQEELTGVYHDVMIS